MTHCPVTVLKNEAKVILEALKANDVAILTADPSKRPLLEEDGDVLSRYLSGIVERASFKKASSAEGALFQIVIINEFMNRMILEDHGDLDSKNKLFYGVHRMLYSVFDWIENESSRKGDEVCEYYMGRNQNPHQAIHRAFQNGPQIAGQEHSGDIDGHEAGSAIDR